VCPAGAGRGARTGTPGARWSVPPPAYVRYAGPDSLRGRVALPRARGPRTRRDRRVTTAVRPARGGGRGAAGAHVQDGCDRRLAGASGRQAPRHGARCGPRRVDDPCPRGPRGAAGARQAELRRSPEQNAALFFGLLFAQLCTEDEPD
jgi:hypothetical protein